MGEHDKTQGVVTITGDVTPLYQAILDNNLEQARSLLEDGSDIKQLTPITNKPIIWAWLESKKEAKEMLSLLIEFGVDISSEKPPPPNCDNVCQTPLSYLEQYYFNTSRTSASPTVMMQKIHLLLAAGADTNLGLPRPLAIACRQRDPALAKLLFHYGAQIDGPSPFDKQTLLEVSKTASWSEPMKLFFDYAKKTEQRFKARYLLKDSDQPRKLYPFFMSPTKKIAPLIKFLCVCKELLKEQPDDQNPYFSTLPLDLLVVISQFIVGTNLPANSLKKIIQNASKVSDENEPRIEKPSLLVEKGTNKPIGHHRTTSNASYFRKKPESLLKASNEELKVRHLDSPDRPKQPRSKTF